MIASLNCCSDSGKNNLLFSFITSHMLHNHIQYNAKTFIFEHGRSINIRIINQLLYRSGFRQFLEAN